MPPRRRRASLALLSLALLPMAACSVAVSSSAGPEQDERTASRPGVMTGGGMMRGGAGGYHWSRSTCPVPKDLPGTRVDVVLGDMGMSRVMGGVAPMGARMMLHALPATVPHGTVTFVVHNRGWRTHELVVLPLAAGATAGERQVGGDGRVSEAGSLGEASRTCGSGEGDGIASGSASWVTLQLPKGQVELVCNLRHHYANGMRQALEVT